MRFFLSKTISTSLFLKRLRASSNPLEELGPFWGSQFRGYSRSSNYKGRKLNSQAQLTEGPSRSPSWHQYIFIPAGLVVIAGAGLLLHYNDERRAIPKGAYQDKVHEIRGTNRPAFGGPFKLIDTEYQLVTEHDLRGHWTLMYFGYTSSPDLGPREVQKMATAINLLESEQNVKLKPVFITLDPQRDSPSQLKAYLKEFDPRIIGLTGTTDAVRQTALEYRVYFKKVEEEGEDYLIASSHNMYLINPNMEIVRCFTPSYDAQQLAEDILKEVRKSSKIDKQA